MNRFGMIGVGNMGYPLLKGAIKAYGCDKVTFYTRSSDKTAALCNELNITSCKDIEQLVNTCDIIMLAVKPQVLPGILDEMKCIYMKDNYSYKNPIVISIAAGIMIADIEKRIGDYTKIIRVMPNTPAMVGECMAGICYSDCNISKEELKDVTDLFDKVGKYEIIPEKLINAVTCASGSSPAYVYMLIEAMADASVKLGLPRDKAYVFSAQAVLGAAKMVLETGEHPGILKDKVCSPAGTTIAGVEALEENGFRNAVMKAFEACYERAEELSK